MNRFIISFMVMVTFFNFIGHVGCMNGEVTVGNNRTYANTLLPSTRSPRLKKANSTMTTDFTLPPFDNGRPRRHNPDINYEKVLVQTLLKDYDISVRPTRNSTIALNLTFGSALTQIIDVDERNQVLTTNCWLNQMWVDESLKWDPELFGGVKVIRIPAERVWRPDVILYNNADSQYNTAIVSTNVIVKYNGNLTWLSSAIFKSSCTVNVEYFPFDEQNCSLKFASWTYDGYQVDLLINDEAGDLSNYVPNGEWDLIKVQVKRNVVRYSCCEEPYPDITYTIVLRRRPLFYVFNLILPCVLISGLALLSFYMPSDSGEKVTLGITTLLSMTVFLMVIGESMPPTSEKLPLIGLYYGVTISLVSFATGLSVVTLSIHHRGMRGGRLPPYMSRFLFNYLAPALLLKLDNPKKRMLAEKEKENQQRSNQEPESNLSCKIPLTDMWRVVYPGLPSTPPGMNCHCDCNKVNHSKCRRSCRFHNRCVSYCDLSYLDNAWQNQHPSETLHPSVSSAFRPVMRVKGFPASDGFGGCRSTENDDEGSGVGGDTASAFPFGSGRPFCNSRIEDRRRDNREGQILNIMNRVLETMEKSERRMEEVDKKDVIKLEWQQAALIVDRLLLWIFVVTTVASTFGILYMSPYTKLFTS